MIIGENAKPEDLEVNPLKAKQLTNFRASRPRKKRIRLTPPKRLTLEQAIAYIDEDELVEVTPKSIRLRKRHLDPHERKRERAGPKRPRPLFCYSRRHDRVLRPRLHLREDPQGRGTSLEIVLSSWCSGRDICTPIPPEDEAIRAALRRRGAQFSRARRQGRLLQSHARDRYRRALPGLWRARSSSRSIATPMKKSCRAPGGTSAAAADRPRPSWSRDRSGDREPELSQLPALLRRRAGHRR